MAIGRPAYIQNRAALIDQIGMSTLGKSRITYSQHPTKDNSHNDALLFDDRHGSTPHFLWLAHGAWAKLGLVLNDLR